MKTHFEAVDGSTATSLGLLREVVDEYDSYECNKGHKWEETLENRFSDLPLPITFPIPNGDNICPFCLSEFLGNIGRIKRTTVKND